MHRAERAEHGRQERSRCVLVMLLIGTPSAIAGIAATRLPSFGVCATIGYASRTAGLLQQVRFAHG
jgi:hypothetical protein